MVAPVTSQRRYADDLACNAAPRMVFRSSAYPLFAHIVRIIPILLVSADGDLMAGREAIALSGR
jgi:hypothetical protein